MNDPSRSSALPQPLPRPARRLPHAMLGGTLVALVALGWVAWADAVDRSTVGPSEGGGWFDGAGRLAGGLLVAVVLIGIGLRCCGAASGIAYVVGLFVWLSVASPLLEPIDPPLQVHAVLLGAVAGLAMGLERRARVRKAEDHGPGTRLS